MDFLDYSNAAIFLIEVVVTKPRTRQNETSYSGKDFRTSNFDLKKKRDEGLFF